MGRSRAGQLALCRPGTEGSFELPCVSAADNTAQVYLGSGADEHRDLCAGRMTHSVRMCDATSFFLVLQPEDRQRRDLSLGLNLQGIRELAVISSSRGCMRAGEGRVAARGL